MARGREELTATIARIGAGEFPVAPVERRDWDLCRERLLRPAYGAPRPLARVRAATPLSSFCRQQLV